MLILRTKELESDYNTIHLKSFKYEFDYNQAKLALEHKLPEIMNGINPESADVSFDVLEGHINPILKANQVT